MDVMSLVNTIFFVPVLMAFDQGARLSLSEVLVVFRSVRTSGSSLLMVRIPVALSKL